MTHACPPTETLSAWLDDELEGGEALLIRSHVESCAACREQVIGWMAAVSETGSKGSRVRGLKGPAPHPLRVPMAWRSPEDDGDKVPSPARLPSVGEGQGEGATTCLDAETLVAYSEAELTATEAAHTEQHLRQCTHCVTEVQRLIRLRAAMELLPHKAEMGSLASEEEVGVRAQAWPWLGRLRSWLESIGRMRVQPWPALGAVAAAALLVLVIVRFLPGGGEVQFRGVPTPAKVEVTADNAIARARPSDDEPIVATLARGTQAKPLEQSGGWTRIELPDGRRVWVRSQAMTPLRTSTP